MKNIDKMLIAAHFAVWFVSIIIVCNICIYELEKLNTRLDNINKFIQDSGFIKVNGELIDADDYYQADWKSYTQPKDSIE